MKPEDTNGGEADIAIIGYAARFPGAENAGQYWENLSRGVESIRGFTVEGIAPHQLETSQAFHSGAIDPILDLFMEWVGKKQLRPLQMLSYLKSGNAVPAETPTS